MTTYHTTEYFNVDVYKKRMALSVEPFLLEGDIQDPADAL
jgi:hypothetical protein